MSSFCFFSLSIDYAFIRLVDESNGKEWCQTDIKGKTPTDKPQLYI